MPRNSNLEFVHASRFQFSLRALLVAVLVTSALCAAATRSPFGILIAWILLVIVYRRCRLSGTWLLHISMPFLVVGWHLAEIPVRVEDELPDRLPAYNELFEQVVLGSLLALAVSIPTALVQVLMKVTRPMTPARKWRTPAGNPGPGGEGPAPRDENGIVSIPRSECPESR